MMFRILVSYRHHGPVFNPQLCLKGDMGKRKKITFLLLGDIGGKGH